MHSDISVAVIGAGRFGRLWSKLLSNDFEVSVFDADADALMLAEAEGLKTVDLETALSRSVIFYAVPISQFEHAICSHRETLASSESSPPLVVELLSVMLHPQAVLEKQLASHLSAMLMHPMFGPDSFDFVEAVDMEVRGKIVLDKFTASTEQSTFWCDYFKSRKFEVIEMTADEHDRLAADSQGLTHFVGRTISELKIQESPIDTKGARKLHEIANVVSNDSWQLFVDLQTYNPYTVPMRVRLSAALTKIFDQLLPNRIFKDRLVIGIQGGLGSFNEAAARNYMARYPEEKFELVYLHTTENVLQALHEGRVDRGQFAMHNSLGGIVTESVEAMARYNFEIVEEFAIVIAHALMIRKDASLSDIDKIMAHPQVFRQCQTNLSQKYGALELVSGEGELVDHAKVAELLGRHEIPSNVATMGSRVLAEIHNLDVVEDNLQDLDTNFTSFLWVQRPQAS